MQLCEFHPTRVAVGRCHKCGRRFCVECAEETGQTRLCKNCMPETIRKEGEVAQAVQAAVPQAPPSQADVPAREKQEVAAEEEKPAPVQAARPEAPLPPLPPPTYEPTPIPEDAGMKEKKEKKEKKASWKERVSRQDRKGETAPPAAVEPAEALVGAFRAGVEAETEDFFALMPELPDITPEEEGQGMVETPAEVIAAAVPLPPEMPVVFAEPEAPEEPEAPVTEEIIAPPAPEPVITAAPEPPAPPAPAPPPSAAPAVEEYDEFDPESFFAEITLPSSTRTAAPSAEEPAAAAAPVTEEASAPPREQPPAKRPVAVEAEPVIEQPVMPSEEPEMPSGPAMLPDIDEGEKLDAFFADEAEGRPAPQDITEEKPPVAEPVVPREPAASPPSVKEKPIEKAPAPKEAMPSPEVGTSPAASEEGGDFLALGPDFDFSELEQDEHKPQVFPRTAGRSEGKRFQITKRRKKGSKEERGDEAEGALEASEKPAELSEPTAPLVESEAPEPDAEKPDEPVRVEAPTPKPPPPPKVKPPSKPQPPAAPPPAPASLDLDDVLATLVDTTAIAPAPRLKGAFTALEEKGEAPESKKTGKERREELKERKEELKERKREEKEQDRAEKAERWDFLSQPRMNEETVLATSRLRTVIVFIFAWLMTALLWSVPNAFFPLWPWAGDRESLLWALVVGACTGLFFWWKAGRKHSTRLAVQAFLVTIFGIMAGEFLHWSFIIIKENAFRKIFVDLISFKFIWEYGGEILADMARAMFPAMFLVLLLLPAVVAFIIGYGMPPIPEIIFEIGRALRGKGNPHRASTEQGATG